MPAVLLSDLVQKVTKTIQKFAEEKCCVIISSPHDTYTIARLINQSIGQVFDAKKQFNYIFTEISWMISKK